MEFFENNPEISGLGLALGGVGIGMFDWNSSLIALPTIIVLFII